MSKSSDRAYRPDIDGLRAVSVLAVLVFHARSTWLPGGFIGVDVFFVISGFLISSHIFSAVETGAFSYKDFYRRRINRILPAFYGVIIFAIAGSVLLLLPPDLEHAARSAARALTFKSNFYFADQNDYFARSTSEYPLLNLWSLSVEEQFYLALPAIALLFLSRLGRAGKQVAILAAIALSVGYAEFLMAHGDSQLAYYSTFARACELLVGTWLASARMTLRKSRDLVGGLGLVAMLASFILISGSSHFPGALCLLPCFGAAAVIAAGADSWVGRALSWRPLVFVGLISYSLYLYHWPVMAFTRYAQADTNFNPVTTVAVVVISFVLAVLSWHFIEKPFRKGLHPFPWVFTVRFLVPSLIGLVAMAVFTRTEGLPERYGANRFLVEKTLLFPGYCYEHFETTEGCRFGDLSKPARILLVGDSYAGQYQATLDEVAKVQGFSFYSRAVGGCFPLIQIPGREFKVEMRADCRDQIQWTENAVNTVDTVVFSGRWGRLQALSSYPEYLDYLEKSVEYLHKLKKHVVFLDGTPVCPGTQEYYRQRFSLVHRIFPTEALHKRVEASCTNHEALCNRQIQDFARDHGAQFLRVAQPYLESGRTLPFRGEDLLYFDDEHLNNMGAVDLGKFLATEHPEIKSLLLPPR